LEIVSTHPELGPLQNIEFEERDVPWVFPLRVPTGLLSKWLALMHSSGIEAFPWPDFPREINPGHEAWRDHYANIVTLPVWWDISRAQMRAALCLPASGGK
jgi:hypothetical protein